MRIGQLEFEHPTQVSRVRLNLYRYEPPPEERVAGMPEEAGFLVTEERVGTTTVVASLGFFQDEKQAGERVNERAEQLRGQGYRPATGPPLQPSLPPGALPVEVRPGSA